MSSQETRSKNFDFSFLPPLPEPRACASKPFVSGQDTSMSKLRMTQTTFEVATKFGPNHFLYDTPMNKPRSLLGSEMVDMYR